MGNVLTIKDPDLNTTTYTYDGLNRLLTDTNQLGAARTYGYDANGNQTRVTDRNGQTRAFTYDRFNRQTQENWLNWSGTNPRTITSTYNVGSQLIALQDPDASYQYTYDLNGRLWTIDNQGTPGVAQVVLTYAYDGNGNLKSVVDKINGQTDGTTTSYTFDPLDRVSQINQSGTGVQSKQVNFTYNALGQMATIDRYAGSTNSAPLAAGTTYTYDGLNRLQQLSHKANGSTIASYTYGYDAASRITSLGSQFANAAYNDSTTYSYDNTNQLAGADHSAIGDEGYTYDANGNRANAGYQTGTGNNNQLSSDGTYDYTYDNEGNLKTRTEIATGKVREFTWDYRNRLTGVTDKTGGTVTQQVNYTYDALNQRIAKTVGAQTTRFVYDRGNAYLEFSGTSTTPSTRYLYGPMVDQVLAQESNGQTSWMLTDHLGSVRDLVNNSGAVVNHFTYDSFGQVIGSTGTVDTRYKFTGREYDGETGLYYYRARYFDAGVGRFIGQDPMGFGAEDANLYRYVGNNSISNVDPSGLYVVVVASQRFINLDSVSSSNSVYPPYSYSPYNNISTAVGALNSDSSLFIRSDITVARLKWSPVPTGSDVSNSARSKVPGYRRGTDDAGHIVGKQLGGSGKDPNNLFAQSRYGFNQNPGSPWRKFEDTVARKINELQEDPVCNYLVGHRGAVLTVRLWYQRPQLPTTNRTRPIGVSAFAVYSSLFGSQASSDRVVIKNPL